MQQSHVFRNIDNDGIFDRMLGGFQAPPDVCQQLQCSEKIVFPDEITTKTENSLAAQMRKASHHEKGKRKLEQRRLAHANRFTSNDAIPCKSDHIPQMCYNLIDANGTNLELGSLQSKYCVSRETALCTLRGFISASVRTFSQVMELIPS